MLSKQLSLETLVMVIELGLETLYDTETLD